MYQLYLWFLHSTRSLNHAVKIAFMTALMSITLFGLTAHATTEGYVQKMVVELWTDKDELRDNSELIIWLRSSGPLGSPVAADVRGRFAYNCDSFDQWGNILPGRYPIKKSGLPQGSELCIYSYVTGSLPPIKISEVTGLTFQLKSHSAFGQGPDNWDLYGYVALDLWDDNGNHKYWSIHNDAALGENRLFHRFTDRSSYYDLWMNCKDSVHVTCFSD